jgi:hypothetical protein
MKMSAEMQLRTFTEAELDWFGKSLLRNQKNLTGPAKRKRYYADKFAERKVDEIMSGRDKSLVTLSPAEVEVLLASLLAATGSDTAAQGGGSPAPASSETSEKIHQLIGRLGGAR